MIKKKIPFVFMKYTGSERGTLVFCTSQMHRIAVPVPVTLIKK